MCTYWSVGGDTLCEGVFPSISLGGASELPSIAALRLPSNCLGSSAVRLESSIEVTVVLDAESLLVMLEVFLNGSLQPVVRLKVCKEGKLKVSLLLRK